MLNVRSVSAFCFDSYHAAKQTAKAGGAMKNKVKTKWKSCQNARAINN